MSASQSIADALLGVASDNSTADDVNALLQVCQIVATSMGLTWSIDPGMTQAQAAMTIKGQILRQFGRVSAVFALGTSRGYVLPDDPTPRFQQINAVRRFQQPIGISDTEDQNISTAAFELSHIALDFDAGQITFDRHQPAAQVASFEVSVDGISTQSGDPLADILGYQPDGDFVKRKRALDALAQLDFSKRKPYLLFTADVVRDGKRQDGTIVCWQKMRDASAYTISKRDVFAMIGLPDITVSNDSLLRTTEDLRVDPHFVQLVSFYDWLGPNDFLAFVDDQTRANTLYSFSVTGLQTRAPSSPFIFETPTSALYLSTAQADQVRQLISTDLQTFGKGADLDSVSPYPAISQVVYGDPSHGWILAGINVLASTRRGDSPDDTRKLSFIGSKATDLLALASAGKLSVPNDIGVIHTAVETAISSFGVSQTILAVLDGTGLTIFISGKDDPLGTTPSAASLQGSTGALAKILATVDPQTATLDPHVLASNLTTQTSPAKVAYLARPIVSRLGSAPAQMPSLSSILGDTAIDLTTYVGIDRLMQLLRSLYDFFPTSLT